MLIFWDASLVLLAVPKTGTQAREQSFGQLADICLRHPQNLKHATALNFRRRVRPFVDPNKTKSFKVTAVMREPIEWLGSWYRYRSRPTMKNKSNATAGMSFDDFIDAYMHDEPPSFANVGRQSGFVLNGKGDIITPNIFAYKDSALLDTYLSKTLGVDIEPKRVNVSPKSDLALSPAKEAELRQFLATDFAIYDRVARGEFRPEPL